MDKSTEKNFTEQNFSNKCEKELLNLMEQIENIDTNYVFDCDYQDGILSINNTLAKNESYFIINRHNASQKIWYSSPISGVDYCSYDNKNNIWQNVKGQLLNEILITEIQSLINKNI